MLNQCKQSYQRGAKIVFLTSVTVLLCTLAYGYPWHSLDTNRNSVISLSELLRLIQFFNSQEFSCATETEDGYTPGTGDQTCSPHDSDYYPQDWQIDLSELLRAIQFFNSNAYHLNNESEDGFGPGLGPGYPPIAALDLNRRIGQAPFAVQFTDLSQDLGDPLLYRTWDFGDGTYSDEPTPLHTYTAPGMYTVKLLVCNQNGCDEECKTNIVDARAEDTYPGQMIQELTSPASLPAALAFDGEYLWCADRSTNCIYKLDSFSGATLATIPAPSYHSAGMAWNNGKLWLTDGRTKLLYRLDPANGNIEMQWPLHGSDPTGLIVKDNYVYVADYNDSLVYVYELDTGNFIGTRIAPLCTLWGAANDEHYFWFVSQHGDEVFMVDPERWQMVASIPIMLDGASGAAVQGDYIWIASIHSGVLRKYRLHGNRNWALRYENNLNFVRSNAWVCTSAAAITSLAVHEVLPIDMPNQMVNLAESLFSPQPDHIWVNQTGQRCAEYYFYSIQPGSYVMQNFWIPIHYGMLRYVIYPNTVGTVDSIPSAFREEWTGNIEGGGLGLDEPIVQQAANEAVGDETNVFWMTMAIHDYVINHITYGFPSWNYVPATLSTGVGVCQDYAATMVALCRSNGIPARVVCGQGHCTAEVWMPGPDIWFPADPSTDDSIERLYMWNTRLVWGSSNILVNHIAANTDFFFWMPNSLPVGTSFTNVKREYFFSQGENLAPIFAGHRTAPTLSNSQLTISLYPAFDPEANYPVSYEGYIVDGENSPPGDHPDFVTTEDTTTINLVSAPAFSPCYLKIVPVNSLGHKCAIYTNGVVPNVLIQ